MAGADVFAQILDHTNRADPYPLYAELRRTPVVRLDDGTHVVSSYRAIAALMHDPRMSSDRRSPEARARGTASFINLDPPEHDRVRRLVMRHFGPPACPGRIDGLRPELTRMVTGLIDDFGDRTRVDIVDDLAYPFPVSVSVICSLLGVPRDDEPRFREWTDVLVDRLDPATKTGCRTTTSSARPSCCSSPGTRPRRTCWRSARSHCWNTPS